MRLEMLEEAVGIIRRMFSGAYVSHHGARYDVENAKLWDLPEELPPIGIAVSGPRSCALAGRDAMHTDLDLITSALGLPASVTARGVRGERRGSAAHVLPDYPGQVLVRCSASAFMPAAYGMGGGARLVFAEGVLESKFTAGAGGQARARPVEYTGAGRRTVDLPEVTP